MSRILYGKHTFVFRKVLGRGAFGDVYLAQSERTGQCPYLIAKSPAITTSFRSLTLPPRTPTGECVAIKKENNRVRYVDGAETRVNSLTAEYNLLRALAGGIGIPRVVDFHQAEQHALLVYELLGLDLETRRKECGGRLSFKTVCMLADQMFARIEFVHKAGILHRDIKPQNFAMGLSPDDYHDVKRPNRQLSAGRDENVLFLFDFGLSVRTSQRSASKKSRRADLVGTVRFSSVNTHTTQPQCFSDDVESLLYVVAYLYRGELPWQKLDDRRQPYPQIKKSKEQTSPEELFKGLPPQLCELLADCRAKRLKPPYQKQRQIFRDAVYASGEVLDWAFDWTLPEAASGGGPVSRDRQGSAGPGGRQNVKRILKRVADAVRGEDEKKGFRLVGATPLATA